jgi:hypothetical protein
MTCRLSIRSLLLVACAFVATQGRAADATSLTPFKESGSDAPAPWHFVGLPGQTKPRTRFAVVELDGRKALRVEAEESYGNLVHPVRLTGPSATPAWQWRVDVPIAVANLRTRQGDDTAVKVCVSFDMPPDLVPFVERQLLKIVQLKSDEPLPTATVCYVWDTNLPIGTELDNAFSRRVRYIVLESGPAGLRQWKSEKRSLIADFTTLFGAERPKVPPIIGIGIGADADNTHTRSLSYVANIVLEP